MKQTPFPWVKKIAAEIPELNAIPLFGNAPPFDWPHLSSLIAARLPLPHLHIRAREQTWRTEEELRKGLGSQCVTIPVVISPMGTVFWMMSQQDLMQLTSALLKPQTKTHAVSSEILQEGFYRYLLLEVLDAIQGMQPLQGLTLHLSEEERLSEEETFCIDLEIEWERRSCWGRLVIPRSFRAAWIHHFETRPSEYIPTPLAEQIELEVGIKTGSVKLQQSEWESLKEGDFVLLDRGETGAGLLMLGSTPLFNVKIHHNKLTLAEYAFYYEETMEQPAKEGEVAAIKELPLSVNVELARLKMSLDQLMHLNPGNVLELPIHPEQSVSLLVNGQKVGRAELVQLGETLGLRILEIG